MTEIPSPPPDKPVPLRALPAGPSHSVPGNTSLSCRAVVCLSQRARGSDVSVDPARAIGFPIRKRTNAELQATDWGSVVQRRANREPVENGGWSVFHTWFTGGFILNPVVSAPFRGLGAGDGSAGTKISRSSS